MGGRRKLHKAVAKSTSYLSQNFTNACKSVWRQDLKYFYSMITIYYLEYCDLWCFGDCNKLCCLACLQGVPRQKSKKRKSDSSCSTANGQSKKSKNSEVSSGLLNKNMSRSSGSALPLHSGSSVWPAAGGDDNTQCSYNDEQDSIKQLAEIAFRADRMECE